MTDILRSDPRRPSGEVTVAAALVLKAGGLAVIPTDTVYGLAADLGNEDAVRRLFELKGRTGMKGLPVLIGETAQLSAVAAEVPEETGILTDIYWPGPLTLVFNKAGSVSDLATGGLPTVAVRLPGHLVCQLILQEMGAPLVCSSANISGSRPSATVDGLDPEIIKGADIVIDGGVCPGGIPSTILDVSTDPWRVLRQGRITREAIETAVGRVIE